LLAAPFGNRRTLARQLLREATCADAHRRRTGRAHPFWGNGTLMSAALAHRPPPEPALDDRDYLACLRLVIDVLLQDAAHPAQERRALAGPERANAA
ncbi:DUF7742 family protein, partial [Citreimonas sp.]|uniref:DUF7742 family protein n=1 Tax=Citreimonas sp. TaxID=3036715 RepID=UPI0040583054